MQPQQQPQVPTQQQHQKILSALMNAEAGELDEKEQEMLREHSAFGQQLQNTDSQIQNLQGRIEQLQKQRSRFEGIAEYLLNKAVMYRFHKMQAAGQEVPVDVAKSAEEAIAKLDADKKPEGAEGAKVGGPPEEGKGKPLPTKAKGGNGTVKEAQPSAP